MIGYIAKRLLGAIPTLWIIASLTFLLIHLAPGGPFDAERNTNAQIEEQILAYYGLDQPLHLQYWSYLKSLARGDLGPSLKYPSYSVNDIIAQKFPISLELGLLAFLFALVTGISTAIIATLRPNSWLDKSIMGLSTLGICMPSFVIGPILILLFSIYIPIFRSSGWSTMSDKILPVITLGLFYATYIAKIAHSSITETKQQLYILTAKAKGLPWSTTTLHVIKNSIQPVISYLGPSLAALITGGFVVETIFQIPGLAFFFVTASFNRDYSLILGSVMLYATMLIFFNLISDILLAWVNPKIQWESK